MIEYLDLPNLQELQTSLELWLISTVLVYQSLVQAIVVLVAFLVGLLLGPRLRRAIDTSTLLHRRSELTQSLSSRVAALSTPIIILSLLWFAVAMGAQTDLYNGRVVRLIASLLNAWVLIRLATGYIRNNLLARIVSWSAWIVAALIALNQLEDTATLLDSVAVTLGQVRISLLTIVKGVFAVGVLFWVVIALSNQVERQISRIEDLSASARVLIIKLTKISLATLAVLIAINSLGIDLTALAVFGGALGIGIGLGLQTVVSNLVSGVLLLMDKSIKPNDVITVGETFGWVEKLGVRYTAVRTRDGIEHIIPNEELITQRVENWSHSDISVRLRIPIGISYNSDVNLAIKLCNEAVNTVERVNDEPEPRCLLRSFGESSLNLEIRVWVDDMTQGRGRVISEILLRVWDKFNEHGIIVPYPQRDLHLKSIDADIGTSVRESILVDKGNTRG